MNQSTPQDQAFLDQIVKLIVTEPDQVEIARTVDDLGVLITLKVAQEDMGRVIGKDGQTAKAIRTLLRAIGSRNNTRVNMKILEPEEEEEEEGGGGANHDSMPVDEEGEEPMMSSIADEDGIDI